MRRVITANDHGEYAQADLDGHITSHPLINLDGGYHAAVHYERGTPNPPITAPVSLLSPLLL